MTYQVIITLQRDLADDCGMVRRNQKHKPTINDLTKQICAELQSAYDKDLVAGSFTVVAVVLNGETHGPNSLTPVEKLS